MSHGQGVRGEGCVESSICVGDVLLHQMGQTSFEGVTLNLRQQPRLRRGEGMFGWFIARRVAEEGKV
jgi:hypothetical protein